MVSHTPQKTQVGLKGNDDSTKLVILWKTRMQDICKIGKQNGFTTLVTTQPTLITGSKKLTSYEKQFDTNTDSVNAIKNTMYNLEKH